MPPDTTMRISIVDGVATVRLTPAQLSALECAGLDLEPLSVDERVLALAWRHVVLTVTPQTQPGICRALTEAANSEEANLRDRRGSGDAAGARGARHALMNLASRIRSLDLTTEQR